MTQKCCTITIENIRLYPYHTKANLRFFLILRGEVKLSLVSGHHIYRTGDVEIINVNEPVRLEGLTKNNLVLILEVDIHIAKRISHNIDSSIFNVDCALFFESRSSLRNKELLKQKLICVYLYYIRFLPDNSLEGQLESLLRFMTENFNDIKNLFMNDSHGQFYASRFLRIDRYLMEHLQQQLSLKKLANLEYLSIHYLSNEFNNKFKKNFCSILNYYRIRHSVKLLLNTEMSVANISKHCGFSSVTYFYKQFKSFFNSTPAHFRNQAASESFHSDIRRLDSPEVIEMILRLDKGITCFNTKQEITICLKEDLLFPPKKSLPVVPVISPLSTKHRLDVYDTNIFASWVLKCAFSDESFLYSLNKHDVQSDAFLSGQPGIYTYNGIEKPLYWALYFLARMRGTFSISYDEGIQPMPISSKKKVLELPCDDPNVRVLIRKNNRSLKLLAVNCSIKKTVSEVCSSPQPHTSVQLHLLHLFEADTIKYPVLIVTQTVDDTWASITKPWKSLGKPAQLSDAFTQELRQAARPNISFGVITRENSPLDILLPPFSFQLLCLESDSGG